MGDDLAQEITMDGMKVVRTGRGCYLAYSQSQPGVAYPVDVSAHDGLGHCECSDFICRRYPRWKAIRMPFDSLRCRHIRRVRNHILDAIIKHYAKAE